MPNNRCRMHGGKSTGPRTPEGLARIRATQTSPHEPTKKTSTPGIFIFRKRISLAGMFSIVVPERERT